MAEDLQGMELIEELRGKSTLWLLSWARSRTDYHNYMPYVLDELVIRAKESPEIILSLADILEVQTDFWDARKPMPSSVALRRVFSEGPDGLQDEIVTRANTWPKQKQEDLIMFGLDREIRSRELARWEDCLGFIRKKAITDFT